MTTFEQIAEITKPKSNTIKDLRDKLSKLHDEIAMLDVDPDEEDQLDRACESIIDAEYQLNRLDKQR
jgi:Asp-tRNA(Asn)/Glu-tRNA(Gln) amidotransferase C subunit